MHFSSRGSDDTESWSNQVSGLGSGLSQSSGSGPRRAGVDSRPMVRRVSGSVIIAVLLMPAAAPAAERWTIGLTATGAPIEALVVPGAADSSPTVLLVGGLQG